MNGAVVPIRSTEPTSLVAVHDQCAAVEAWAERCTSVPELRDASNKLAAIDEYLGRTSTEGRARVAAAMRHLEARIGDLLGPAKPGPSESSIAIEDLSKDERSQFRAMAEHEDVVEEVIAESTDENPPSRRKVMKAIKDKRVTKREKVARLVRDGRSDAEIASALNITKKAVIGHRYELRLPPATGVNKSPRAAKARREKVAALVEAGMSDKAIGEELGITERTAQTIRQELGLETKVPRRVRLDLDRVMDGVVSGATVHAVTLEMLAGQYDQLDPDRLEEWDASLTVAIQSLQTIRTQIRKAMPT